MTCDKRRVHHWSFWGCNAHSSVGGHVDVVITTSANRILLPPSQLIGQSWLATLKWHKIPGYNSLSKVHHWSYWGCNAHSSVIGQVNVVITTSTNSVLLLPSQFMGQSLPKQYKWSKIPGYNSLSPELVLSVFSSPLTVTSGQVLRLWYGEDLVNFTESENDGTSCCDVFARFL